ncbi:Alpha/Beta hydrolase protein [Amylostereum chailletii]|nr:Alpha/Beta hydrolase protein [Amylostereum chailletii]
MFSDLNPDFSTCKSSKHTEPDKLLGNSKLRSTLLPISTRSHSLTAEPFRKHLGIFLAASIITTTLCLFSLSALHPHRPSRSPDHLDFFSNITRPQGLCSTPVGHGSSHAGYIGLQGDSEETPKRSFFWFFEAENDPDNAPIILTMGGGPGTSALMYATFGQSPCFITADKTVPNPDRWTEKFNLIALDHPVNVGFSYGTHVNSSRAAAFDAYDFLQKFFRLFPQLSSNQFVIAGGSYGGVFVPNIATVIHEQNRAIQRGEGMPGAQHINLDSMMLSNPFADPMSHYLWLLHYRCEISKVHDATTCGELYALLPSCLESIDLAYTVPSLPNRVAAADLCYIKLSSGSTQGRMLEDVRRRCVPSEDDPAKCHPEFAWVNKLFHDHRTRHELGIPDAVNYTSLSMDVNQEFYHNGDLIRPHTRLYEPLLRDGIRLLHYVGAQDANCAWPGIFSALKRIQSPFQEEFITASDVPWPTKDVATVRSVGPGAGNFTFILLGEAGHFVVNDQRTLVKKIVERWIENRSFEGEA